MDSGVALREPQPAEVPAGTGSRSGLRGRGAALAGEALLMYGLLVAYKLARSAVRGNVDEAYRNAFSVMALERRLGLFVEPGLQQAVLGQRWLVSVMNRYYVNVHLAGTGLALLVLWITAPAVYARTRRVMVVLTGSALVVHVLYPLAPPRMFPRAGFVDTGLLVGPSPYSNGVLRGVANQYAAMPSLHFGWSLLLAWAALLATAGGGRWRCVFALHPVATAAVVVLTANHYWLDLAVAGALFAAAMAVAPTMARPWTWLRWTALPGTPLPGTALPGTPLPETWLAPVRSAWSSTTSHSTTSHSTTSHSTTSRATTSRS